MEELDFEDVGFEDEATPDFDPELIKFDWPDTDTDFTTHDTAKCITNCIGKGNHFCLDEHAERGRCCKYSEDCPRVNYCSFESPDTTNSLKLWACPYSQTFCGPTLYLTAANLTQSI